MPSFEWRWYFEDSAKITVSYRFYQVIQTGSEWEGSRCFNWVSILEWEKWVMIRLMKEMKIQLDFVPLEKWVNLIVYDE